MPPANTFNFVYLRELRIETRYGIRCNFLVFLKASFLFWDFQLKFGMNEEQTIFWMEGLSTNLVVASGSGYGVNSCNLFPEADCMFQSSIIKYIRYEKYKIPILYIFCGKPRCIALHSTSLGGWKFKLAKCSHCFLKSWSSRKQPRLLSSPILVPPVTEYHS